MNKTKCRDGDFLSRKIKINQKLELTTKQQSFIDIALHKHTKLMFVSGPAGTSKTYLSIYCALELLNMKCYDQLIYTRSVIESADGKLGFLPGEEEVKLAPYLVPLRDKLSDMLTQTEISFLQSNNKLRCEHVGFSRGQNWENKVIVIDEAQNLSQKEIITLITRVAEGSKVFLLGDPLQSDIGNKSGFSKMCNIFHGGDCEQQGIYNFEFNEDDIVRSQLVKFIIQKIKSADII